MEFRLLGPVEVLDGNGAPVEFKDPKVRCVLAIMLCALPQVVTYEEMDYRLWGEVSPGRMPQENTRQKYVGALRAVLKDHDVTFLSRRGNGYYWIEVDESQVDLSRFNQLYDKGNAALAAQRYTAAAEYLTRALELWRGPALTGVPGDWAAGFARRLNQKRAAAQRLRFQAELETGPSWDQIASFAAWHDDSSPDDESVVLLMKAYCRRGRADLAVTCYQLAKDRMNAAGRVPHENTQRLLRQVREGAPELFAGVAVAEPGTDRPPAAEPVGRAAGRSVPIQVGVIPDPVDAFQVCGVLRDIEAEMAGNPGTSRWILSGLGGTGKTQLAASLAGRLRDRGQADVLVWITASSRQSVVNAYSRALTILRDREPATADQGATEFLEWLSSPDRSWLIVLDDLDAPATMTDLWPPKATAAGRVLVTTRRRDAALGGRTVVVTGFSAGEARSYLAAKLSDRPDLAPGSERLAAALGYLPLALSQAAAYLLNREITGDEYRERLAAKPLAQMMPDRCALPDGQRMTVEQTWLLSVDHANTLDPPGLAGPVLELASQLDPAGVPEQVFTSRPAIAYLSSAAGREVSDSDSRDALRCLQRLSLVSLYPAEGGYRVRVHALVQKAARDRLPAEQRRLVRLACADALVSAWPGAGAGADPAQAFRGNALALAGNDDGDLMAGGVHEVLFRLGQSLGESGSFAAATAHLCQVHVEAAQRLGPDHRDILRGRLYEAYWLGEGGDHQRAVRLIDALTRDCRRALGPEDRVTFDARLYAARNRGKAGELQRARQDLVRLAEDMTRAFGHDDRDTMTVRNDAAWSVGKLGDSAGALREFAELREDRERVLEDDDPHILVARNNLAHFTAGNGDSEGALRAYEDLLPDMIRILGFTHQYTLATRGSIADLRGETGDRPTAVRELQLLIGEMRRELGRDHPITAKTVKMLANQERKAARAS